MRVRYTPRAFADREAIFEYIDRRNPRAAREVKAFIIRRIARLGDALIRHRMIPQLACMRFISVATPILFTIALAAMKFQLCTSATPRDDHGRGNSS
jgi:plasmid stabilization system protein ParE